ncbi:MULTISPECIES: hypothetical protein [Brachybacterium]|uniref:Integral membrane protein n=2 Tax=Brachybacterium TaxID=43668 RepID=A0ABS1B611_9MICO|nr:hypothetical protein [Brachybacterium kimchii]MBK0330079.1 hypothetical protein [Brachybacterium halotolerans]UQN30725.1 hypothetical protein M4486_05325 [Brachybacterium kimchii]
MGVLAVAVYALSGLTAALALLYVAKSLAADFLLLAGPAAIMLVWLIEGLVWAYQDMTVGPAPDRITLYGYLLTGLVMPLGAAWLGATERTRWGSAGIALAAITQLVLQMRLPQIWPGGPA